MEPPPGGVVFTAAGLRRGIRASMPLIIGLAPFGAVVGVVSQGKGLSLAETLLMCAAVYAGSAQLLALELWSDPAPLLAACLAAFAVNIRMAPMGAALAPWMDRLRGWRLWVTLGTLVDHSFAMGVADMRAGGRDAAFLLGIGLSLWLAWMVVAAAGHLLGGVVQLPAGHPLFYAATATFVALLVPLWRSVRRDLWPWAVAALVALAALRLGLPQPAPLLGGAMAGAALAAWRESRPR
jgi:4-azaleucine resistance transporter AzlC